MNLFRLYNSFDKFAHETFRKRFSRVYSTRQLKDAKCNFNSWQKLSASQKKQIVSYWGLKNPVKSDFLTHEIMLNVKGEFDVRYCPEKIFRLYLDPALGERKLLWAWDDKNYFDRHQPSLPFPNTFVRNANGYFLDKDYNLISKAKAKKIMTDNLPFIIKPSLISGEGKNIRLISNKKDVDKIFLDYEKDYVVQERIAQCEELEKLGADSVNIMRVVTAMVDGKPKHLTSQILCNTTGSVAVNANATPGEGVVVIKIANGKLSNSGYFENAKRIEKLPSGFAFGGLQIPSYKEALELALETHKSMPMFGFIGWDITIDKNNKPVFIEWNLRGIEIYHSQLTNGPLFGKYSDYFADMAREMIKRRK